MAQRFLKQSVAIAVVMALADTGSASAQPNLASGPFTQCLACHSANKGEAHMVGPNLFGIYGNRIASQQGFVYSKGLSAHKGNWTEAELHAFLQSPQTYAPATKMAFAGLEDPTLRQQVIDILRTLH